MIAIAAYVIPKKSMNMEEIALLSLTAAATFAIGVPPTEFSSASPSEATSSGAE